MHPIYFSYPYAKLEDVTIELPVGWPVGSPPNPYTQNGHVILFGLKSEADKRSIRITRNLNSDIVMMDQKYYPLLRKFFEGVRNADQEQVVVQTGPASKSN